MRTRAAASSMASGIPSSRRQIVTTAGGVVLGHGEARARLDGAIDEQPHRIGLA